MVSFWTKLILGILGSLPLLGCVDDEKLNAPERILGAEIYKTEFDLRNLTMGLDRRVIGSKGKKLYRVADNGSNLELLYDFAHPITGIHVTPELDVVISTDTDIRDPASPCSIYISKQGEMEFSLVKQIAGACALSWSFTSDRFSTLYMGEYGPKKPGIAKKVWRTTDKGKTWRIIFSEKDIVARETQKTHIHRVAIDPFTNYLWVTVGDGVYNRGIYLSKDGGESWKRQFKSQATGVAFTKNSIFWGEDDRLGVISEFNRKTGRNRVVLNASENGNFGGSVYSLLMGARGTLYAAMMKYPDQSHIASLWSMKNGNWNRLIEYSSVDGVGVSVDSIAGPDSNGWIYVPGFKFLDR